MTVKCHTCGSFHIRMISWIDALRQTFYFCSMKCKREFLEEQKEKGDEETETSVLPEVRVFTARKEGERITVVRGEGGFHGRGAT